MSKSVGWGFRQYRTKELVQITLDETVIQCIKCKKEDLTYYREPTVNYSNQKKIAFFVYYLQCNSCKRHFAYMRKECVIKYKKQTKLGECEQEHKLCIAGFYDLEDQPNYGL